MKKKVLVVGGAGFIGVNLIEHFLTHNYDVIVYGRNKPLGFDEKIIFVEGTLCDIHEKKHYLKSLKIDTAIYLVNTFPVNSNATDYHLNLRQNTIFIEEIFAVVARFIFFSSGGRVYHSSNLPHDEDETLSAICDYGRSKIELESFITNHAKLNNKKFLIVRPSNPYGPYQTLNGSQGLIAILVGRIITGKVVDVWGTGNEVRDYIYIKDFVSIFYDLFCTENPKYHVYNIGSGIGTSTFSILNVVRQFLPNYSFMINQIPNSNIIESNILCNKRVLDEIGGFKFTSISTGIESFIKWLGIDSTVK
ncbi:NAD-dependent epimerase/dehydratase family protein [Citrobacter freundii]|uniref:NAD-dependent epimerase/dehydratase family protein n=1 Tax=Citrobacter freundii TaxID=546 RepID=UPI0019034663|nr:NAD-dependent epimerase/dehydratase family protein [Citrobacter freundii]MBJ9288709.1 NAD-dependent epimerase/dehydratase family protein [Citrobacter freundii]MCR3689341.1 NAD-dependent epimerase/dehydratase family protein [Citrobacter freundii]MDT7310121.1 NAD-dependent epimerase/dehydratase family protein [Citrobacter freundii]